MSTALHGGDYWFDTWFCRKISPEPEIAWRSCGTTWGRIKAMFNDAWGGYPAADFLAKLDPKLGKLRATLERKLVGHRQS